jgi:hypothetical protein
MKMAANLPIASNPAFAREENTLTALITESFKPVRRNHRRKKKLKTEKVKPAKAKLPNGWYFRKPEHMKRSEFRKMAPGKSKEPRKKLRGARQKQAAKNAWLAEQAEIKLIFEKTGRKLKRLGQKMYCMDPGPHRLIIFPHDLYSILGLDPRPASRYLTRLRKKLNKPRGSLVTVREFLEHSNLKIEDVIPHLK